MVSEGIAATHAFSYKMWGYEARIDNRVENQVIRLNSLIAGGIRFEQVQKAHTVPNGTPFVFTEEELNFDMDDESLLTGVVVGKEGDATLLNISQKGASVRTLKREKIRRYDPTALLVVCPCFKKNVVFYVLTDRDEVANLRDAVAISGKEVFFFSEFRNDTNSNHHGRKDMWVAKTRAMMMGKAASKQDVGDKIPVSLEGNLSTNLASFYLAYRANNDDDDAYGFNAMKKIFSPAMPELEHQLPKSIELFKLMSSNGELKPSDCIKALRDIQREWSHAYDAIGNATVLCHVITAFRTLEVEIPHNKISEFFVFCSDIVKEMSDYCPNPNYAAIGRSSIKKIERTAGKISVPSEDSSSFAGVTIYSDVAGGLESLEHAITALQEAHSASGGSIAGLALDLVWVGHEDDSAKLRATSIHIFAMHQLAGQIRRSLASVKKEAAAQA